MESRQQVFARQLEEEARKMNEEREAQRKKEQLDKRLDKLVQEYVTARERYGETAPLTVMLGKFLEISSRMQDVVKTIESFTAVSQYITELLGFINSSVQICEQIFIEPMGVKSGFFDDIKRGMDRRRGMANLRGTIKNIKRTIKDTAAMAVGMTKEFAQLSDELSSLDFGDGDLKKDGSSNDPRPLNLSPEIQDRINKISGGQTTTTTTTQGGGGYVPPRGPNGGGNDDFSDLF